MDDFLFTRGSIVEEKLGMTLLGVVFSSMLYGITLSQTYTYFRRFPLDPLSIKLMVLIMSIMDTASAFLITHAGWFYLVQDESIDISSWSLNSELALSMVISGLVEAFLVFRVWMLSEKRVPLTVVLVAMALLHFVSGEYSAALCFKLQNFSRFEALEVPSILRLASGALCDTAIAISLCYFLNQKRTGFKRTDKIIDHLIVYSINTGMLTSITSIVCLITYAVMPITWVYLALCFLLSKLYANTFLCSLNSRQILIHNDFDSDLHAPTPHFRTTTPHHHQPFSTIDVYVVTETVIRSDENLKPRVGIASSPLPTEGRSASNMSNETDHSSMEKIV